jgi:hypothetical protein
MKFIFFYGKIQEKHKHEFAVIFLSKDPHGSNPIIKFRIYPDLSRSGPKERKPAKKQVES